MSDLPDVGPGQVWADNDWRVQGRTIRVDSIDGERATCTVLTNDVETQKRLDEGTKWQTDQRGKTTRVLLRRMRPTSTGYKLISDSSPSPLPGGEERHG